MKLEVFYHIWGSKNLEVTLLLIDNQLTKLYESGLALKSRINCVVSGNHTKEIYTYLKTYDWIDDITMFESDLVLFEGVTLNRLYNRCLEVNDTGILYFHTKGSSVLKDASNIFLTKQYNNWRHSLDWAHITQWKECVKQLNQYDIVSFRKSSRGGGLHPSGNYWWANSSYIRTLESPLLYKSDATDDNRLKYEFWIASKNPPYKHIFSVNNDIGDKDYWEQLQNIYA
jgi:hypothetical protein